jgi:hypothetical protein
MSITLVTKIELESENNNKSMSKKEFFKKSTGDLVDRSQASMKSIAEGHSKSIDVFYAEVTQWKKRKTK